MMDHVISYVTSISRKLTSIYRSNLEKFSRYALNALTELRGIVVDLEKVLRKSSCICSAVCKDKSNCRFCHRWFMSSADKVLILKKLSPLTTISFNGSTLTITTERSRVIIGYTTWRFKIYDHEKELRVDNEDDLKDNLSLIINTLSDIKVALSKAINDMELCSKEYALTC